MKVVIKSVTDHKFNNKHRGIIGDVRELTLGKTMVLAGEGVSYNAYTSNVEDITIHGATITVTTVNTIYTMELL